ncbi:IS5 family transposase (plasmid) [Ralstonia pseudosolanacearum]|nr:IS5 family transposase [Ralstonia pseudosolanacearum]BEU54791.1 IS5 family transposase [Ralstonia pseudosolanacearum]
MARKKISNELWKALQPLLPVVEPSTKGGRPRVDDRAALNGILFVLHTGIPWEDLPKELGFGSGMTCWRRLREWQANGVWERLHLALLKRLREHDQIDWSRASVDGATVASPPGGEQTGPNPTDRGKLGSKRHLVVDRRGVPLALMVTGANRHDSVVFEVLVDAIPSVPGLDGRPRCRPDKLHADKGYDFARCRRHLRKRGMTPPDRSPWHREERPARQASLGCRAHPCLACWLRQVAHSFRAFSSDSSRFAHPGLRRHLRAIC